MATKKKSQRLLYIVRNNFTDEYGYKQTSILGVYTSLKKAYVAGHAKATEMDRIGYKHHYMEMKIVRYNTYNYVGCSAYNLNFKSEYTSQDLHRLARKIHQWFDTNSLYVAEYESAVRFLEKPPASKEAVNYTLMLLKSWMDGG